MNGVQTRFKCKLDVKRCKRFVFPPSSLLPRSNALKTKAIRYFQTDRTLTRIVSPPLCAGTGELNPELSYQLEEPTLLTNVIGFTNIADWGFRYFEQQKSGHLVTISSVGGTRGSGIAPAYNASKAYQINYMEGLRQKATKSPYSIYTTDIRPGFVDTAMAKGEGLFWVTPVDKAVKQIKKAISKKKKVAFISKRWRYVTILFRLLPSAIYCRM